jgi:hypothetical protein
VLLGRLKIGSSVHGIVVIISRTLSLAAICVETKERTLFHVY